MGRLIWLPLLLAGCANAVLPSTDDGSPGSMDAGSAPVGQDSGQALVDAGATGLEDAGPPRACAMGCEPLERCVDGLCAPYPPCGGDGTCPGDDVCQRRTCLPRDVDLDGDGAAAPEDCSEGDAMVFPGADERCNSADDDCDGTVDEAIPDRTCSTACGGGMASCVDGVFAGCSATMPQDETCNDMDDDCDGRVDESLTRECSTACGGGTLTCVAGEFAGCTARMPSPEACNGVDDDCDGTVDGMTRSCSTACGSGTETCTAGSYGGCTAPVVLAETCNLVDDDCNGTCDDPAGGCRVGVHRSLSASTGEHFYSTSRTEVACCGFTVEAFDAYWLYPSMVPGLVPFYRCLLSNGFHFYTTSSSCEGASGSTNEGVMGYLSESPTCGSTPLYRLASGPDHLYTTSASERDSAVGIGYVSEGVAGHVWAAR